MAEIFKQHVEAEGQKLVKAVTEEIESKKEKEAGAHCLSMTRDLTLHPCRGGAGWALSRSFAFAQTLPHAFSAGKAGPSKDSGTPAEQQFVRCILELHDKYVGYVSGCFANASLFHKSLKARMWAACLHVIAIHT